MAYFSILNKFSYVLAALFAIDGFGSILAAEPVVQGLDFSGQRNQSWRKFMMRYRTTGHIWQAKAD